MPWILTVSLRRNLRKYLLAIIGLAAAVALSCIGASGTDLLWRVARHPMLSFVGGDMMVMSRQMQWDSSGSFEPDDFRPVPYDEVARFVRETIPGAKTSGTLIVPYVYANGDRQSAWTLHARADETEGWIYKLQLLEGQALADAQDEHPLLVPKSNINKVGDQRTYQIPKYHLTDITVWDMTDMTELEVQVSGIYGGTFSRFDWTNLPELQRITGMEGLVSYLGVAFPNPPMAQADMARLQQALGERFPDLHTITAEDLAGLLDSSFDEMQRTAAYYIPVMLLISVQIVVVTALAIAFSRRQELVLMRTLGLSRRRIRLLFVCECLTVALVGSGLGLLVSSLLSQQLLGGFLLNILPVLLTVIVTVLVAGMASHTLLARDLSQSLRNS